MPRIIITVKESTPQPYRFDLSREEVTLGRGPENDVVIDCGSVSVHHAVMQRVLGGYQLRDLASTNGTKLNDIRMNIVPLTDGTIATLGDVSFDFTLTHDEKSALAAEAAEEDESPTYQEEAVAKKKSSRRPAGKILAAPAYTHNSSSITAGTIFSFLICGIIALYIGAHIRHQQDTNSSLLKDIVNRSTSAEKK